MKLVSLHKRRIFSKILEYQAMSQNIAENLYKGLYKSGMGTIRDIIEDSYGQNWSIYISLYVGTYNDTCIYMSAKYVFMTRDYDDIDLVCRKVCRSEKETLMHLEKFVEDILVFNRSLIVRFG
jgi:hypothetical protein